MKLILILVVVFISGCNNVEHTYHLSESTMMDLYKIGWQNGYAAAQRQNKTFKQINDSMITFDYTNSDTVFIMDSLQISRKLFK